MNAGIIIAINALIDGSIRLIELYNSLPDSDAGLKADLEELKGKLGATAEKVKAYQPLDV